MRASKCMAALGAAVLALAVSACSSSSNKSGESPTSSGSASSTKAPTGTPIKVVAITDTGNGTDRQAGVKIGVAAVNATGGINGHPLSVTYCTDSNDANQAAECARNAVNDNSTLAVVGTGTTEGTSVDPIIEAGGLASVGNFPITAADFTCKVCFNDSPGLFSPIGADIAAVKELGATRIGVPYIDAGSGGQIVTLINNAVKPFGASVVKAVPVSFTATDLSPVAAAIGAAHPTQIPDFLTSDLLAKFLHAYRQQGFTTPYLVSGGIFDENGLASVLSGANSNLYLVAEYDHQSSGYRTFLSDFQKYSAGYSNHNDEVLGGYYAVKEFAYAASHAPSLTRAAVLGYMNTLNYPGLDGLTPPINYAVPQTAQGGTVPRIFADDVWLLKYTPGQPGTLTPVGSYGAINVFTGQSS